MSVTISGDKAHYLGKLLEAGEGTCCLSFVGIEGWRVRVPFLPAIAISPVLASALASQCPCENDAVVVLPGISTENIEMLVDFMMGETIFGNRNDLSVLDELCRQFGIYFDFNSNASASPMVDNAEEVGVDDGDEGQKLMNNGNSDKAVETICHPPAWDAERASFPSNVAKECPVTRQPLTKKQNNSKKKKQNNSTKLQNNSNKYLCDICSKTFMKRRVYVRHLNRHASTKNHQCSKCYQDFPSKLGLLQHWTFCKVAELSATCASSNDSQEKTVYVESSPSPNTFDTVVISSTRHVHDDEKNTFNENAPPKNSVQLNKNYDFKCDICKKGFSKVSYLNAHKKIHTEGQRPLNCKFCDGCFLKRTNLQAHELRHLDLKFFACPVCSKRFYTSAECRRHERIHSAERPFGCYRCNKTYKRADHLKLHIRTHYKEYM